MKYGLVITLLLLNLLAVKGQDDKNNLLLVVDSLPSGMYAMGVQSLDGTHRKRRFKYVSRGKAKFRFRIRTASEVRIMKIRMKPGLYRSERIICYTEPGSKDTIYGTAHENGIKYRVIGGSKLNDGFMEAREYLYASLEAETMYEKKGLANRKVNQADAQKLLKKSDSIRFNVIPRSRIEFAKNHLDLEISSKYLWQNEVEKDSLYALFDRIPESTKQTYYGARLRSYVEALRSISVGELAPDFVINTPSGESDRLYNLAKIKD